MFYGGWHFAPITATDGKVVGCNLIYLICADAGGNIPKTIQDMVGPKQAKQVVKNLYAFIKQREAELGADRFLANISNLSDAFNRTKQLYESN